MSLGHALMAIARKKQYFANGGGVDLDPSIYADDSAYKVNPGDVAGVPNPETAPQVQNYAPVAPGQGQSPSDYGGWNPTAWNVPGKVMDVTNTFTPKMAQPAVDDATRFVTGGTATRPMPQPTNASGDPYGPQLNISTGKIHNGTPTSVPQGYVASKSGTAGGGGTGMGDIFGTSWKPPEASFDKIQFADAIKKMMDSGGTPGQILGDASNPGLIKQLQDEAAGNGPRTSLAQALMQQAADANIKKGAGLIASTRGINPGVAAKLAADQSAQANQAAAAQGAQLGLEGQIAARTQLGNLATGVGGLENQKLGIETTGNTGQAGNIVHEVGGRNDITGKIVGEGIRSKGLVLGGAMNAAGVAVPAVINKLMTPDGTPADPTKPQVSSPTADGNAPVGSDGVAGNASTGGYSGPDAPGMSGNSTALTGGAPAARVSPLGANTSWLGTPPPRAAQGYSLYARGGSVDDASDAADDAQYDQDFARVSAKRQAPAAGGGDSSGDHSVNESDVVSVLAPILTAAAYAASGGRVPGRAKVQGNSYENDTVDAKLSPGEIVIPRTAADDPEKAHRFVDHIMGKKGKDRAKGFGGVLEARRELETMKKRMGELEMHLGGVAS